MRALPFQHFGLGLRIRKPERGAVVMRDREPKALRREGEPARGRRQFERLRFALAVGDLRELAGRPRDRRHPGRARHGRSISSSDRRRPYARCAGGVDLHHLAVVAAGDDAGAVARRRQDAAVMQRDALRHVAIGGTSRAASSASMNAASSPRKCIAIRPAGRPAASGRRRRAYRTAFGHHRTPLDSRGRGIAAAKGLVPLRGDERIGSSHAVSKPVRIFSSGRCRPMNTSRLSRFSSSFHGR